MDHSTNSPLHQLELQVSRARTGAPNTHGRSNDRGDAPDADRSSIYSFESISSNARLLDTLGLDEDHTYDRNSVISVQSTGRLLDRLQLDDKTDGRPPTQNHNQHQNRVSSANDILKSLRSQNLMPVLAASQARLSTTLNNKRSVNVRNVVYQKRSNSITSFLADVSSDRILLASTPGQKTPESFVDVPSSHESEEESPLMTMPGDEFDFNSSSDTIELPPERPDDLFGLRTSLDSQKTHESYINDNQRSKTSLDSQRSELRYPYQQFSPMTPRRIASDSQASPNTSPYKPTRSVSSPSSSSESAESRIKTAIKLRAMGNHREASYQLQISANPPNNHPRAMFLYAMALSFGQGVKKNDRHSLKWLCKCIVTFIIDTADYLSRFNELQPEELLQFIMRSETFNDADPQKALDYFSAMPEQTLAKYISSNSKQLNVLLDAYHEVGNALINGLGLAKPDEQKGIQFLSKAASLGYVNSMVQLGEIWSNKSKTHKKDLYLSAAWLRLSELFGHKSIGNSWIYKEKYMKKK